MKRPAVLFAMSAALVAAGAVAGAHPGHDAELAAGAAHWFTEPSHWIVIALSGLLAAELLRRGLRALATRRILRDDRLR